MKVWCAICGKPCDEVFQVSHDFHNSYAIHVRCHGETDSCEFDPKIWLLDPNARITDITAFKTKRLEDKDKGAR